MGILVLGCAWLVHTQAVPFGPEQSVNNGLELSSPRLGAFLSVTSDLAVSAYQGIRLHVFWSVRTACASLHNQEPGTRRNRQI